MMRILQLGLLIATITIGCSDRITQTTTTKKVAKSYVIDYNLFRHGVASGDPLIDQVIIWTRVTTDKRVATVKWEMSTSKDFLTILQSGISTTDKSRDYTVKIDVILLEPDTYYYYRFITEGKASITGRTKTLSAGSADIVSLGIVSCSNFEFGYFNAYNKMASLELDAILHLGDYIYEYGPNKYGDKNFSRKHLPPHELLILDDYRIRYAQYRTDKGLQKAHQQHPFIAIWDDHEVANNVYETGAQNHQPDEGDFLIRKAAAKKAYFEWQPIRESDIEEIYRSFHFGNLVDLYMLDERLTGRNEPATSIEDASAERSMLGAKQLSWLKNQLSNSSATWKIIGNQVIFSPCDLSLVRPDDPVNLDAWDGYARERDDIVSFLSKKSIDNTIFVTGDTHASWAFEVPRDISTYTTTGETVAIEIGTPSITSSNMNESLSDEQVIKAQYALKVSNPHLKYVNGSDHGFTVLNITLDAVTSRWYYSKDIKVKEAEIILGKELSIKVDELKLK